jgi:hypothetical protein
MAGINRALVENRHIAKLNDSARKPCIFMSHISVDKTAAVAIGRGTSTIGPEMLDEPDSLSGSL